VTEITVMESVVVGFDIGIFYPICALLSLDVSVPMRRRERF